jgi:hypothetical protein
MQITHMRSTIVVFIIVFAALGLLLGFAASHDTQPANNLRMAKDIQLTVKNDSDTECEAKPADCFAVFQKP